MKLRQDSQGVAEARSSVPLIASALASRSPCASCRHEAQVDKLRQDGRAVAEAAREEVVQPLRREVEAMRQQLEVAKQTYQVGVSG